MINHYISVIVVCYNYAHLLERTLLSIINQTFNDYELIFVNNGSTDNTEEVYYNIMGSHPEIDAKYVKIEINNGPAEGDNEGVKHATGDYLLFVDADDWMDDDCLMRLSTVAKQNDADRVIGSYRYVNQNNECIKEMKMRDSLNQWLYTMQQANLFKRSIYVDNHIFIHDLIFLDAEKTLKFSSVTSKVSYSPDICYNYYVHESTSNNNKMAKKIIANDGRHSYTKWFHICKEIYDSCSLDDRSSCILQIIRLYYSFIIQGVRGSKLSDAMKVYSLCHSYFSQLFPHYLNEIDYSLLKTHIGSKKRKMLMRGLVMSEKLHLFKIPLSLYVLMTRKIYFTT